jgi:hypothetical protein
MQYIISYIFYYGQLNYFRQGSLFVALKCCLNPIFIGVNDLKIVFETVTCTRCSRIMTADVQYYDCVARAILNDFTMLLL